MVVSSEYVLFTLAPKTDKNTMYKIKIVKSCIDPLRGGFGGEIGVSAYMYFSPI
jgi:hypothetical protein